MPQLSFVGLGAMGAPMAENLIRAGYQVTVYDLNTAALKALEERGAHVAMSKQEAVQNADIIVSMLPNDAAVREFFIGSTGVIPFLEHKPLIIDCSTISIETTKQVASVAAGASIPMVDAPVSGGPTGAKNATLSFMVGGEPNALEAALPVLQAMGKVIIHMGPSGSGQAAKICNNMLAAIIMAATAEAIALGVRNGLNPTLLCNVIKNSSGGSFLVERWNPWPGVQQDAPSTNDYNGGFQLQLMLKDLSLAMANAEVTKSFTPFGALSKNLYTLRSHESPDALTKDFSYIQTLFTSIGTVGP